MDLIFRTPEVSVGRKKMQNEQLWFKKTPVFKNEKFQVGKTKLRFEKPETRNSGFQKHEVSGRKNEASVRKTRSFGSKIPKFRLENP
jgi:hypothetical protein